MSILQSVRAVAGASGEGHVDWTAAADAAKASTDPGSLALSAAEREAYASDVREARDRVRTVTGVGFDLPATAEVQNRHHWMDANVETFARVMEPLEEHAPSLLPDVARTMNTGTMGVMLAVLGRNVLGQYDPLLLAEGDEHALYFVHPNIERVAGELEVDRERFRRWIAFHEVAHAAEFGGAPWLSAHLEERVERGVDALAGGTIDRDAFRELDAAMTAVEGYAELVMDRAFDEEYADLREKLDERRRGRGPLSRLLRRVLGLGLKRRQYERGKEFFETVADEVGVEGAAAVWERPANLPTDDELDQPREWLRRVNP